MLRWNTRLTDRNSNVIYIEGLCTYMFFIGCHAMIHDCRSYSNKSGMILPSKSINTLCVATTAPIVFSLNKKRSLLQCCSNAETQDDEKLYEITLFSECAVIPFLQESYRLKHLSKMACSEANRWSFETHRRHRTIFINNLAYIAHHKHAYILSTNREIARESRREKGEKIFAVQKEFTKLTFIVLKIPTTRGQEQDWLRTRKIKSTSRD